MTEPAAGPSGPGTVVLDLGVDVGALILYTRADLDGAEIEISRDDDPGGPAHALGGSPAPDAGRDQATPPSTPAWPAGPYTIWRDEHSPAATVTIAGGQVTSCRWPACAAPSGVNG